MFSCAFCEISNNFLRIFFFFYGTSQEPASEDYFSSHQRNVVCQYKLYGKPTMILKHTFSLAVDIDVFYCKIKTPSE